MLPDLLSGLNSSVNTTLAILSAVVVVIPFSTHAIIGFTFSLVISSFEFSIALLVGLFTDDCVVSSFFVMVVLATTFVASELSLMPCHYSFQFFLNLFFCVLLCRIVVCTCTHRFWVCSTYT